MKQERSSNPDLAEAARGNAVFFAVAAQLAMGAVNTGVQEDPSINSEDPVASDWLNRRQKKRRDETARIAEWTAPIQPLLGQLSPESWQQVKEELTLIREHQGPVASPTFGGSLDNPDEGNISDTRVDYSDFLPRGHYTRSETLRRFFLFTRWLASGPFRLTPELTRRALLLLLATDDVTLKQWQATQDAVRLFAGEPDAPDLAAYDELARAVYGRRPTLAALEDREKLADFIQRADALPDPKIAPAQGKSFRFWLQPYTLDAEVMQRLVYDQNPPDVGTREVPRYFALGLDVMAALGSQRAHELLTHTQFQGAFFDNNLRETEYENYEPTLKQIQGEMKQRTSDDWEHNLYTRTLYTLISLLNPAPQSRWAFTQSPAWTDKCLNEALATWAGLKHDTMPKQPISIEAGGEGGMSEVPLFEQPRGFVEPSPEVFRRLMQLTQAESALLKTAGYLTPDLNQRLNTVSAMLAMFLRIAEKQETGQPLTGLDIEQLRFFGVFLEHLTLVLEEGQYGTLEGNDMAIIADVSSAYSTRLQQQLVLEEGVGRALPLWVAVERDGHRELTRGAAFTYYEFTHPAEDRLTDEKWRELLDSDDAAKPKPPAWTNSYITRME